MKKLTLSALLVSMLVVYASQSQAAIIYEQAMNMTAFWDFNGPNPLADRTGNGNNLTLNGGGHFYSAATASGNGWAPAELFGTPVVLGDVARVANMSGGNGYDMPGGIYSGGSFTFITAQRRDENNGNFRTLLGTNRFRYQNVGNTLQGAINAPGGSFGGSTPLSINDWHFIALTYDAPTGALLSYSVTNSGILGVQDLTGAVAPNSLNNITALRIGNDGLSLIGGPDGFFGQMDFAAFQDGLLSTAQLQAMLNDFVNGAQAVPEPSTFALLGLGVVGLAVRARRRRRAQA